MRLLEQIKKRQIAEYKVQLAIAENPHKEKPELLWEVFNEDIDNPEIPPADAFDKKGLDGLKQLMAKGTSFRVN